MTRDVTALAEATGPLLHDYDLLMLDLDGVVYIGAEAVPGAADALSRAKREGATLAYVTNNASRTPQRTAERLRAMGMPVSSDSDVVTSALAAAHVVADLVPAGSEVLVLGAEGLYVALTERGLRPVGALTEATAAVVQGFNPESNWHQLAEGTYGVHAGLPWVASNTDLTFPTARGIAPGNGSFVQAIVNATGRTPTVAGKPHRALFDETAERVGGTHPLIIGDRLDTDIEGANNFGADSLAVLTGVTSLQEIADADPHLRPTFVAPDLDGLFKTHNAVRREDDDYVCGSARVTKVADAVKVIAAGDSAIDIMRAALTLAWQVRAATGRCTDLGKVGR